MDGWIRHGANARYVKAAVPRMGKREWLAHSDTRGLVTGGVRVKLPIPPRRISSKLSRKWAGNQKKSDLSRRDLLMIYKFPCCWPARPAPGGGKKADEGELAPPNPLDRMTARNAPRRHAPVRNSPPQSHIFAQPSVFPGALEQSRPIFDTRRPEVCALPFFDIGC